MNRRSFLKVSGALIGSQVIASRVFAKDDPPTTTKLSPGPHLLLDNELIESQSNFQRVVNPPQRLPTPVVTGPEDKNYQPYVTVLRDPATRRFRMWYGVPVKEGQGSPSHLAYIESDDGVTWKRPHRVLDDPGGLEVRFGCSVIDEGPSFADPQKRFKYGWFSGPCPTPPVGGLMVAMSPDGLTWTPITDHSPVLAHNHDINGIFRDPIRKRYGAIVSMLASEPSHYGNRRLTFQSVSDDLVHWATPWPILVPDEHDEPNTEFYAMSGVIARGNLLIGLVKVLRDDLPADVGGERRGIGYTTLAWSRDGVSWTRDREPFMQRNLSPGTWDHAMTWADCQFPVDDEVFIYYGGYARGHKIERFTERQIGLARTKKDRYIARRAGEQLATLRTKPLLLNGASMTLNAAIRGEMTVGLIDATGKPIAPPVELKGDSVAHPLPWKLAEFRERPVVIEFRAQDADLFGWENIA